VVSFERVSVLAGEIASAAQEQSQGLGEVNLSVGQMDEITQKNAQMVEQTNDALHKLSLQAKDVQRLLGSLQIEPNSPASTGAGRGPSARGIAA
jgi:methyl-accepting chemotaxis protein